MQEPEVWVVSSTSKPTPKWLSALAVVFGCMGFLAAYRTFSQHGITSGGIYNLLIGLVCVYGAGLSRKLYLSDIGVVREVHSWGRVIRRTLPWDDIRHVTLAFRGKNMVAFFEIDVSGWKIPFHRDQEREVREALEDAIPNIQVDTMGK